MHNYNWWRKEQRTPFAFKQKQEQQEEVYQQAQQGQVDQWE